MSSAQDWSLQAKYFWMYHMISCPCSQQAAKICSGMNLRENRRAFMHVHNALLCCGAKYRIHACIISRRNSPQQVHSYERASERTSYTITNHEHTPFWMQPSIPPPTLHSYPLAYTHYWILAAMPVVRKSAFRPCFIPKGHVHGKAGPWRAVHPRQHAREAGD